VKAQDYAKSLKHTWWLENGILLTKRMTISDSGKCKYYEDAIFTFENHLIGIFTVDGQFPMA